MKINTISDRFDKLPEFIILLNTDAISGDYLPSKLIRLTNVVKRTADTSLEMMMTFFEVKGQMGSNKVNYVTECIPWLPNLGDH